MRFRRLVLAAAAVAAAVSSPRAAAQQGAPVRIRLGTLVPQGTSYHHILQAMGERWRTATNGQVQLTVYAGTMGSELELVRRMRLGQLQAATLTGVGIGDIDPAIGALQEIPMMFRTMEEFDYVRAQLEPELARRPGRARVRGALLGRRRLGALLHAPPRGAPRRLQETQDLSSRPATTSSSTSCGRRDSRRSSWTGPDALTGLQTGMIDAVPTIPFFRAFDAVQYR